MLRLYRLSAGLTTAAALAALAGCGGGGPRFCDVKGKVVYNGKPLPGGLVQITDEADTQSAIADLNIDGEFTASRAPAGPVRVVVRTEEVKSMLDEKTAAMIRSKGGAAVTADPKVKGNKYVPIPSKYWDRDTTDLKYDLKPDTVNELTIELKK
jgi:hypothetical protein